MADTVTQKENTLSKCSKPNFISINFTCYSGTDTKELRSLFQTFYLDGCGFENRMIVSMYM